MSLKVREVPGTEINKQVYQSYINNKILLIVDFPKINTIITEQSRKE